MRFTHLFATPFHKFLSLTEAFCIRSYPLFYAIFLVKSTLQTDSLGHFFRFFQKNFFTFFHLPITLFIFSVYVSGFSLSGIGKQWITIFFTNIAIPAPAPYGASLCLLGTPQSPAKCAAPFTKHTLYFAITPCGVAFRAGAAYVISLPSAGSCTSAQEGKKYVSLFMALAESSLRFIAFFPIRHYNKTYHRREEKVCLLMKISNR